MKMKRLLSIFSLPLLAWFMMVGPVNAAEDAIAPQRIAVIDFKAIMQKSPQAKVAVDKLKKQFSSREQKLKAVQDDVMKKEATLKRDGAVLTATEKRNLQTEILSGRRDLQRLREDFRQDVELAQDHALQEILNKVNKAISEIAQKENYDVVLEKNRLPYVNSRLDITEKVIKSLQ